MNLDDLKSVWKEAAQADSGQWAVNSYLLKEVSLKKTHALLGEYKFTAIFETFAYSIFWICIVQFMVDHWQETKFLISAAFLGVFAWIGIGWGIYKWWQIQTINYELPLAEAQKRIARFQLFDRRDTQSLIIQIPIFFLLFVIVAGKSWFGVDLFLVIQNWAYPFVGSLVVSLIITWVLLKFPDKELERARVFLKEIEGFEREE